MFAKLEQTIYKKLKIEKKGFTLKFIMSNKKIMNGWKFLMIFCFEMCVNCLHNKVIDTYLIIVFRVGLHPYIQLSTT
jgi:hypothetical protein